VEIISSGSVEELKLDMERRGMTKVEEIDEFDGRVEGVVYDDRWISR
jgi:hypothetical protein